MSAGACVVAWVCVAEYVCMVERKIKGGIVSKYFENTFRYNRRIGFTDAPPLPSNLYPIFFGTNLPKTGRVLTLTETGLNPNRNGS